jgi:hypothetical protein
MTKRLYSKVTELFLYLKTINITYHNYGIKGRSRSSNNFIIKQSNGSRREFLQIDAEGMEFLLLTLDLIMKH